MRPIPVVATLNTLGIKLGVKLGIKILVTCDESLH